MDTAYPWLPPASVIASIAVAVALVAFLVKARRNYLSLPEVEAVDGASVESVTAIVPARNEERSIERCVKSLAGYRVVVVDDQSEDRTAERARAAGAEVIAAPKLLKGQLGKSNACLAGSKLADTTYILFADADTWFDARFVPSLVKYSSDNEFILVSPFLKQHCVSLFEKIVMPYAFGLSFTAVNAANVQNFLDPETLANGQCMLFLRQPYEFIGGHNTVMNSVVEDVALAAKVKRHRMKLQIVRAERLGHARSLDAEGLRRISQASKSRWQTMAASLLLTSVAPLAIWLAVDRQYWMIGVLAVLVPLLFSGWYGNPFQAILSLPAIYLYQLAAIKALLASMSGRKSAWKGRKV